MAHTISIDVVDMTIPELNNRNIPIINQPNPCYGYEANANEVRQLIQLSNYKITEAGTNKPITGNNYYEYFPEEQPGGGGGGGGVTPAQVEAMIENSIDAVVSSTSKNAIQNKVIKKYVDDNVSDKVDKVSGKGLSTNDYTTADKEKLTGIEEQANKTVVDDTLSDSSTNPVQNKVVQAPFAKLVNAGQKNLLKITGTSQTIRGVTFTVSDDGTVTVNGTNTGTSSATFILVPNQQAILIPDGDYWFLGCPQGGGANTFDLRWFRYSPNTSAYDTGSGVAIHKNGNTTDSNIAIVIKSGVTVNNITFTPMLCTAEDYKISPEFVPYRPSYDELTELTETNKNNISKDEAALVEIVDSGAKNLLKNTATSQTINGVTFTVNADKSVTVSGTATSNITSFFLSREAPALTGNMVLSGCPAGGSFDTYRLDILDGTASGTVLFADYGEGTNVDWSLITTGKYTARIRIGVGTTVDGLIFKPMLCTVEEYTISPAFVPHVPTNRDLYEGKIDHDIPALTESILDYAVSLPAGLYFTRHGAEVGTDKPETGKRYMYQIMKYSASTMTLIAYEGQSANSDSIYMKNYTSSNWGPWIKFTGTAVSYAMSNADLTEAIQDTQSQLDNQ